MEPDNLMENWELIGEVFYETSEVYEMDWVDKVYFLKLFPPKFEHYLEFKHYISRTM